MKKVIILMLALATTTISCSSDDGGGEKTQSEIEMLTENGDWKFQDVEVLEIMNNSEPPRSKSEIEAILMDEMTSMVFKFHEDGVGSVLYPGVGSQPFPYNVQYSGGKIETIQLNEYDLLKNVTVTKNSLEFTWDIEHQVNEGDDNNSENWVYMYVRFTMKH